MGRSSCIALMGAILCATSAQARHAPAPPAPVAVEDLRLTTGSVGIQREMTPADYAEHATRTALDVRYGPADSTIAHDGTIVSTWRVDGDARDGSMRAAGIARIVVVQTADVVHITLSPLQAPHGLQIASAN